MFNASLASPSITVGKPHFGHAPRAASPYMLEEHLPFTVRLVRDGEDLAKAVHIRHSAYARHVPVFADTLRTPEAVDLQDGFVVLLAESKLDGSPLGTMRIQTNQYAPLCLENSLTLPDWLQNRTLAEATRLGITNDRVGRLVKTVLFKAFFLYCQKIGVEWMVVSGRAPVDRLYDGLLFSDVYPGMGYIPLPHVGNMPHRIMSFEVGTAEARWEEANHPLREFIFRTHHVDIDLSGVRPMQRFHTQSGHFSSPPAAHVM